jgi:hypothetical protein
MKNVKILLGSVLIGSALAMSGCAVYPEHDHRSGYGPPPHAPANGYRYKYYDHDLMYDSGLGVYIVVGVPDFYFIDGLYYRHSHDGWYYSREYDRDWQPYKEDHDHKLPPGVAKKYRDRDDDRDHGKDRGGDRDHGKDRD